MGAFQFTSATLSNLDEILTKIIAYQTAFGDLSWRNSILLPLSFSRADTDGGYLGNEMITNFLTSEGIDPYRLYEQSFCIDDSVFDSEEELLDGSVHAHWQTQPYGMVTWWAHGTEKSAGIGYDALGHHCGTLLHTSDCPDLDNARPAIVFACSCLNAYPENPENLMYSLLKQGAIAAVSGAGVTLYCPGWTNFAGTGSNPDNSYEFTRNLVERNLPAGKANALWKSELTAHPWNAFSYTLYGDPEIHYSQQAHYDSYYVDTANGSDSKQWIELEFGI